MARRGPWSAAGRRPPARQGSRQLLPLPPPPRPKGRNPPLPDRRPPPCSPTSRDPAPRRRAGDGPAFRAARRPPRRRGGAADHHRAHRQLRRLADAPGAGLRAGDRDRGVRAPPATDRRRAAHVVVGPGRRARARRGGDPHRGLPESAAVPRVPARGRGHAPRVVPHRARARRLVRAAAAPRARRCPMPASSRAR